MSEQSATPELSDERILHLWDTHVGEPTATRPLTDKDKLAFARSVLAHGVAPSQVPSGFRLVGQADFHMSATYDLVIGTDLYVRAAGVPPSEVERLRAEQAAGVMPQIGPLLDAWDGMDNDTKAALKEDAPDLARALAAIGRAMDGTDGVRVDAPSLTDVEILDIAQDFRVVELLPAGVRVIGE